MGSQSSLVYRFAGFELDASSGELRKNGIKKKIQDQPFHVLLKLLDHTGEIVTREDLQLTLWPADTYVGFETGLNTAIKRLREVLGDSAENPTFIGTIPKRGYRFLVAVDKLEAPVHLPSRDNGNTAVQANVAPPQIVIKKPLAGITRKYALFVPLALFVALGAGFLAGKFYWRTPPASFHRLTFRRGFISSARFGLDRRTIIYAAAWDGNEPQLFSTRSDYPESRELGLGNANLLAISATGQMAIARAPTVWVHIEASKGTLAQVPLAGGGARDLLDDTMAADWDSTGTQIALAHWVKDHCRLEFPVGRILYESKGYISSIRISPKRNLVAFLDHPTVGDDRGFVVVVDPQGKKTTLTQLWASLDGLAWSPKGDEVWFTASASGVGSDLYGVTLTGHQRVIERIGARLVLQDISPDGLVLLTEENYRLGIMGRSSADGKERDLSWLDFSALSGLSADGKSIVFYEQSEVNGPNYTACIRKVDGSPVVRLGEGLPNDVSPDGTWVLATHINSPGLFLLPTGTGQVRRLEEPKGLENLSGRWFPDGKQILVAGNEPGRLARSYIQSVDGSQWKVFTGGRRRRLNFTGWEAGHC